MRDVLRDVLRVAAEAAGGVVVAAEEVRRRAEGELRERVPEPVQVAVAGAVGVVRGEAEKVWSRVGDGMVQVGVVLEFLEQQIRQIQGGGDEESATAPDGAGPVRAEQAFPAPRKREAAARPVRVVVDEDPELAAAAVRRRAAVPGMQKTAPAARQPVAKKAAPAAKRTPAEKPAPTKKTAAKKTAAKKTTAVKKTTAAKKTTTAQKTAAARKAPARKAVAEQPKPGTPGTAGGE